MPNDTKTPKAQARKARQEAVRLNHRDLSTDEIATRIEHHQTLIGMYDAQRTRSQRAISEASNDVRTCDKMLDELRADVSTLSDIVKSRRG